MLTRASKATVRCVELCCSRLHNTKLDSLPVGVIVHSSFSNVEATSSGVDSSDGYIGAIEGQLPASSAVGRVEASDRLRASDEGESGQ